MKKYVKPELFLEPFELSQAIADCAWEVNSANIYTCEVTGDSKFGIGGKVLFTEDRACNTYEYCYMAHSGSMRTFQS